MAVKAIGHYLVVRRVSASKSTLIITDDRTAEGVIESKGDLVTDYEVGDTVLVVDERNETAEGDGWHVLDSKIYATLKKADK